MKPSIAEGTRRGPGSSIGPASVVGYEGRVGAPPVVLGANVTVGCFCVLETGCSIGDRVDIDHYCRVGAGSRVGDDTRLLYGAQIFEDARIGARCIIGGPVDDRTVIEDDVTYMGSMAHSYRLPGTIEDWDFVVQPSAVIRAGAVVGQDALLVGPVEIGAGSYIGAGETVRSAVPPRSVLMNGEVRPIEFFRGLIQTRTVLRP